MNFSYALVVASVLIVIAGAGAYIRDTLSGKTKPNRVSWAMWALAPLIGTAAALASHADAWATARIFFAGFLPLLIFAASFINPKSYWKLTGFDLLCGLCAVLALLVWGVADSPRMAILFAALADGFAGVPTLVKAWRSPETETGSTYFASLLSTVLIIPSIPIWNIENSAFQVYLLVENSVLLLVIYRVHIMRVLTRSRRA